MSHLHTTCILRLENITAEYQLFAFATYSLSSVQTDGYALEASLSVSETTLVDVTQNSEIIAVTELEEDNKISPLYQKDHTQWVLGFFCFFFFCLIFVCVFFSPRFCSVSCIRSVPNGQVITEKHTELIFLVLTILN